MNGYSKIRVVGTTKSRSIDFSDLFSPPQTPKTITNLNPTPTSKTQETKETNNTNTTHEAEDGVGERFGVILSRNCSVSSTSSQRVRTSAEKQNNTTLQSAVKRALSMRKCSSVSEGYWRIHDQCDQPSSPTDDAHLIKQTRSKNKRGKILKACKRLFGL